MGGFSDNYECGYQDFFDPRAKKIVRSKTKCIEVRHYTPYEDRKDSKIYIRLSSSSDLAGHQKDIRENLERLYFDVTQLEYEISSSGEILVYFEDCYIGSVDTSQCSESQNNTLKRFLQDNKGPIELFWSGENFYFQKSL